MLLLGYLNLIIYVSNIMATNVVVYHLITFFQGKNSLFYTFFQSIFRQFLTLFQLLDDIINQKSLSARVCRKAQHFIGTLQYF